jgi:hypothetical protein
MTVLIGLACAPADGRSRHTSAETESAPPQTAVIEHVTPRRDSVGRAPAVFEWTRVEGADSYAIGLWNEVDVMLWRQDRIHDNHVDWPKEIKLDPGTYFWSVTAIRADRSIAESGLAAFIVRE